MEIELDVIRHVIKREFPQEVFDDYGWQITLESHPVNRGLKVLAQRLLAGQILQPMEWSHPLNWKEALKERFAPKWLKKRWKVKYRVIRVEPIVWYPEFKLDPMKHKHKFIFNTMEGIR